MNKLEKALDRCSLISGQVYGAHELGVTPKTLTIADADAIEHIEMSCRLLLDTVKRYANEDAWTGQFSKDGRQDLWLYGEGKATAVQALKSLGDIVN